MSKELIDRYSEIAELKSVINSNEKSNLIIILTGTTGVGKGGLVEKLNSSIGSTIVRTKVSKSSIQTINNLQYFNAVYSSIAKYSIENNALLMTPDQYYCSNTKNLLTVIMSLIRSKLGFGEAMHLSEETHEISTIRKKDYIVYTLSNSPIILNIENIQNIDTESLELLGDILSSVEEKVFIFEYTITAHSFEHYQNLVKELNETNAKIIEYRVHKMDFNEAVKLVPKNLLLDYNTLEKLYNDKNGNLLEIIMANTNTFERHNSIKDKILALNKNELYILFLIFLNGGSIPFETLFELTVQTNHDYPIISFSDNYLDNIIQILCSAQLIKCEKDDICIYHHSFQNELRSLVEQKNPVIFDAYSCLKEYYLQRLQDNERDSIIIEKLISLFIVFSDEELLSILPHIKTTLKRTKYPQVIIKKLAQFRKRLYEYSSSNSKTTNALTLLLTEVCLENGLIQEAQENLNLIYNSSNKYHIALQGAIYSLQENNDVKENIKDLIDSTNENSRLRCILETCYLSYKMKLHSARASKMYAKKLLNNEAYKKYKEYGIILRNYAELCEENSECISYYNQAMKCFNSHNMLIEMASIYLSLSMIYSYEGELNQAQMCIEKAIELGGDNISCIYILNNKSAIQLLENTFTCETEKNLKDALLLCTKLYERIILQCNLLIYYVLSKQKEKAKTLAEQIEQSDYDRFQYEEILHIVYQNLYYFYSTYHDPKSQKYYSLIVNLINNKKTRKYTRQIASSMLGLKQPSLFFGKFNYRVDFLGYWEFNIDREIEHS